MKRALLSFCLAVVLAVAGSVAFTLSSGPEGTEAIAASYKTCRSKLPTGKIKTWRCATNQACCVNHSMSMYVCGIPGLGCL